MMMGDDNLLSQDDIDSLMQGFGGEGGQPPSDLGGGSGKGSPDDFSKAIEFIVEQAMSVVSTVLNKTVKMGVHKIEHSSPSIIEGTEEKYKDESLLLKTIFKEGIEGDLFYVLTKKDSAMLADLMMMGDGNVAFEEDHKDALAELFNQIMGAVCTALGTELSIAISSGPSELVDFDLSNLPFDASELIQATISLDVEGIESSEFLILLSPEIQKALKERFGNENSSKEIEEELLATEESTSEEVLDLTSKTGDKALYATSGNSNIDMLMDIPLEVTIELGRSELSIRKILELGPGSIIELDRKASEPVDLLINDKIVARGEVVVVDEYFGIRIVSLLSPEERIKHLR